MQHLQHQTLSFECFTLDLTRGCLLSGTEERKLRPKSFEVLKVLVENAGRLISKEELIGTVWPDTAVTDDSLVQCLIDVRRALGESGSRLVKTVPRRGYIFDAEVLKHDLSDRKIVYTEDVESFSITLEEEIDEEPALVSSALAVPVISKRRLFATSDQHKVLLTVLIISVLLLCVLIVYLPSNRQQPIESVAVMPFVNVSGDPEMEYLAEGLTESIIRNLSQSANVRVMSRTSVFRYKGKVIDPQTIGRELGVRSVLVSRLELRGNEIRINVELVDAQDNRVLWAGRYDRKLSEILQVQSEISGAVSDKLRPLSTGADRKRFDKRYTENADAYQAYLKGRYWWNKRTEQGFKKGIEYFNQAIALDSNYALAYSGLADCYALLSPSALPTSNGIYFTAKAAAAKALEIDDQLAEAHTSLAHITWLYEWDWATAEKSFRRAIELNPNYATAHQWYAVYLSAMGRHEEALREVKRALELDPVSLPIIRDVSRCFYHARRYDEAISQYMKLFELEPNHHRLNSWLEMSYEQKGFFDQAIELRLKAMTVIGVKPERIAALKKAYAESGWQGYWRKEVEFSEGRIRTKERYVDISYNMARAYARLGENDRALHLLEKAFDEHSDHLVLLKVDPIFDRLRSDPRLIDLLRRVGLPQ